MLKKYCELKGLQVHYDKGANHLLIGIEEPEYIFTWWDSGYISDIDQLDERDLPKANAEDLPDNTMMWDNQIYDMANGKVLCKVGNGKRITKLMNREIQIKDYLWKKATTYCDKFKTIQAKEAELLLDKKPVPDGAHNDITHTFMLEIDGKRQKVHFSNISTKDDTKDCFWGYVFLPNGKDCIRFNSLENNFYIFIEENKLAIINALKAK